MALSGNSVVPGAIVQYVTAVSLPVAIEQGEQLSKISREAPMQALRLVAELVKNLANFFKTKRSLESEEDFLEVASLIIEGHKLLKVEEIAYAFKLAKLGRIGKVFDRLDGATVLGLIETYHCSEERAEYFEKRNSRQAPQEPAEKFATLGFFLDNADKLGIDVQQIGQEQEDKEANYRKYRQDYIKNRIKPEE